MTLIVSFLLAISGTPLAHADDTTAVHVAAHFGTSYAINMISYGFAEKVLGEDQTTSFIVSALFTLAVGLSYKLVQSNSGSGTESIPNSMLENSLGVAAAGLTVFSFNF